MSRMPVVLASLMALVAAVCSCGKAQNAGNLTRPSAAGKASIHRSAPASTSPASAPAPQFTQQNFTEKRTINYASCEPPNNALLNSPPQKVSVSFTKELAAGSYIEVTRDGKEVQYGPVEMSLDSRSMSTAVYAGTTGNYKVRYWAYFASGYYEVGTFGFSVLLP